MGIDAKLLAVPPPPVKKTLAEEASASSKRRRVEPSDESPSSPEPEDATVERYDMVMALGSAKDTIDLSVANAKNLAEVTRRFADTMDDAVTTLSEAAAMISNSLEAQRQ